MPKKFYTLLKIDKHPMQIKEKPAINVELQ